MNQNLQKYRKIIVPLLTLFVLVAFRQWRGEDLSQAPKGEYVFTKHARCRMDCRQFTQSEVLDVIQNGHINRRKSNPKDRPCPTVAYEKTTVDGQKARVVTAACEAVTKVVTVIDLGRKYACKCK